MGVLTQVVRIFFLGFILYTVFAISNLYGNDSNYERPAVGQGAFTLEDLSVLRQLLPEHTDSVLTLIESDYEHITASGDQHLQNRADYLLGLSYFFNGMYLVSNYYYDKVIRRANRVNDYDLLEAVYNNKGINLQLLGYYENSVETYLESLSIAKLREDSLGIGQSYLNLGILFEQFGETDRAIEYTSDALHLFTMIEDSYHIALANMNYASFKKREDSELAVEMLYKALHEFKEQGDSYRISETYYHLSVAREFQEEYESVIEYALKSLDMNPVEWLNNLRLNTYIILIDVYYIMQEPVRALPLIQEIHEAITLEQIHAVKALDYFWPVADRVLSLPENRLYYDKHNIIKEQFITSMERIRFESILSQFDILSSLEPDYADSIEVHVGAANVIPQRDYAFILLWMVSLGLILGIFYLLRGYFVAPAGDLRSDYIIQKVMNQKQKVEEDDDATSGNLNDTASKPHVPEDESVSEPMPNDFLSTLFSEIDQIMMEEQLFKNPELSREYLAKRMHTNKKYISTAIKQHTGLSFKDYLNSCAISLAIATIKGNSRKYTNYELAKICGYSSETTFYRNFKKATGLTPSQFKKRVEQKK